MMRFFNKKTFVLLLCSNYFLGALDTDFQVSSKIVDEWDSGYQVAVTIANEGVASTQGWQVAFSFAADGQQIQDLWNGEIDTAASKENYVVVHNPSWPHGGVINPGDSIAIGLIVRKNLEDDAVGVKDIVFTPINNQELLTEILPVKLVSLAPVVSAQEKREDESAMLQTSSVVHSVDAVPTVSEASDTILSQEKYKKLADKTWASLQKLESRYKNTAAANLLVDNYGDVLHSEGIAYGMLIALGYDDKASFLHHVDFMAAHLDKFGLMNWNINTDGSVVASYGGHYAAADADLDIVYALIQGLKKWPEIADQKIDAIMIGFDDSRGQESAPITKSISILELTKQQMYSIWDLEVNHTNDIANNLILPGDGFGGRPFSKDSFVNVSYFRPTYTLALQEFFTKHLATSKDTPPLYSSSAYKSGSYTYDTQEHDWNAVKNKMYEYTLLTMQKTNLGLPPAWSNPISGVPGGMSMDFQYDAVRVLQFLGMDYQQTGNVQAKQILEHILGYYNYQLKQNVQKGSEGRNIYASFGFPVSLTPGSSADHAWMKSVILPPADLRYKFSNDVNCCNPGNPMIAASLMIAAHAMGPEYKTLEQTCFDYLMSPTDGAVIDIPYFAGSLTVMAAQFLAGVFP